MLSHGVLASVGDDVAGAGGGGDYGDAVAVADFFNGVYQIDGIDVASSTMIDRTDLITGSGLSIDWDIPGDVVEPLGDFLAKLCEAELTIVMECLEHVDTDSSTTQWLHATDSADPSDFYYQIFASDSGGSANSDNENGVGGSRNAFATAGVTKPATRKIAFSRASDHIAISSNGSTVSTDSNAWSGGATALDGALIGALVGQPDPDFKGLVRSIIVYPLKDDAELPTLSTIV